MRSLTNPGKGSLLPRPHGIVHWKYPHQDDWTEVMDFVTVPSAESGECLHVKHVLERDRVTSDERYAPMPGERCTVSLEPDFFVAWWNWGAIEEELKGKRFVYIPDPSISGRKDSTPKPNEVLSYGCWETEDEEGYPMLFLDVVQEGEPAVLEFEE